MQFGLEEKDLDLIKNIFSNFIEIEEVIIFGSRATGTEKINSDIDLALKGKNINFETILEITNELDELPVAYTFDVLDYDKINSEIKEQIDKNGKIFFKKEI
jgi:predicted nucleotidyltransferase